VRAPSTAAIAAAVNRWWWPVTGIGVAAVWVGVVLADSSRFPPLAAAAAAGTAVLAAAPSLPVAGVPGLTGVAALLALPLAVAEAARGGNAAPLGVALGVIGLLAVYGAARDRSPLVPLLALVAGLSGVVAGLTLGSVDTDQIRLAITDRPSAAVVVAGAVLVLVAIDHRTRAERAVVAPVLLATVLAAPALPPIALIVGWGALAVGAALVARPLVACAALAVVAAAAGVAPAALLLAAGAVLIAVLDGGLAAVCVVPGAVALAGELAARSVTGVRATAAVVLALTVLALAIRFVGSVRVDGGRPVGLVLAAWLVVAPGSWRFAGAQDMRAYDTGALRAVAVGALVALAVLFRRGGEVAAPAVPDIDDADVDLLTTRPAVASVAATAATVASVGWLVVSVVRLH